MEKDENSEYFKEKQIEVQDNLDSLLEEKEKTEKVEKTEKTEIKINKSLFHNKYLML